MKSDWQLIKENTMKTLAFLSPYTGNLIVAIAILAATLIYCTCHRYSHFSHNYKHYYFDKWTGDIVTCKVIDHEADEKRFYELLPKP